MVATPWGQYSLAQTSPCPERQRQVSPPKNTIRCVRLCYVCAGGEGGALPQRRWQGGRWRRHSVTGRQQQKKERATFFNSAKTVRNYKLQAAAAVSAGVPRAKKKAAACAGVVVWSDVRARRRRRRAAAVRSQRVAVIKEGREGKSKRGERAQKKEGRKNTEKEVLAVRVGRACWRARVNRPPQKNKFNGGGARRG